MDVGFTQKSVQNANNHGTTLAYTPRPEQAMAVLAQYSEEQQTFVWEFSAQVGFSH
jgi:hypothetical protein